MLVATRNDFLIIAQAEPEGPCWRGWFKVRKAIDTIGTTREWIARSDLPGSFPQRSDAEAYAYRQALQHLKEPEPAPDGQAR